MNAAQPVLRSAFPHRIVSCRPLLIAGVVQRCRVHRHVDLPGLWGHLDPHVDTMACVERGVYYGVPYNQCHDGGFDYLAGVEVDEPSGVPDTFSILRLALQRYAVFPHSSHVSGVRDTFATVYSEGLPALGYSKTDAPYFERYDADFDRLGGTGGCEVWIPLAVGEGSDPP